MKKCYVYTLSDPRTNEVRYIGKTLYLNNRFSNHLATSKFGKSHKKNWIKNLLKNNLKPVIEVLEEFDNEEDTLKAEAYWIQQFKAWNFKLTNLIEYGVTNSFIWTEKSRKKLSQSKIGQIATQETRNKLSKLKKEKFKNDNFKKKILNNLPKNLSGENNGNALLKEFQVLEIIKRINNKEKAKSICKDYEVKYYVIDRIKRKETWKHLSNLIEN